MINMMAYILEKNVKCKASENSNSVPTSSRCHCRVHSTSLSYRSFKNAKLLQPFRHELCSVKDAFSHQHNALTDEVNAALNW